MGSQQINPMSPNEPELHLLLAKDSFEEPLYKSLFRELDEFFFPKKLPPLVLESKPEPVKDIWGFYDNRKKGALGATGVHVAHHCNSCGWHGDRTARRQSRGRAQADRHPC